LSTLRLVWIVAEREIRERLRSTAFRISTLVILGLIALLVFLPRIFGDGESTRTLGIVGERPELEQSILATAAALDEDVEATRVPDRASGEIALRDGDLDALLDGDELVYEEESSPLLSAIVQQALRTSELPKVLDDLGLTPEEAAPLLQPAPVREVFLETAEDGDAEGIAFITVVAMLGAIMTYGQWVLNGVAEEKTGRIVELLLVSLRPVHLLAGKVLGIGALALGQLAVVAGVAAIMLPRAGVDLPGVEAGALAFAGVWFVLGFIFYATAFAAAGAMVARQEDIQSVSLPITMTVLVGYFVSIALVTSDPKGSAARVVSFLPPVAPMMMPARYAIGAAQGWEVAVAAGLMLVGIVLVLMLGGRIYGSALLSSRRFRLTDVLRRAG